MAETDLEYTPFLQLVHFSDMHVLHPGATDVVRDWRRLRRIAGSAGWKWILDETAPHDRSAPSRFCEFLAAITLLDKTWATLPTWLVDTGDQTSAGDPRSLEEALDWLDSFQAAAGGTDIRVVYGNHDAWPEKFPLAASPGAIAKHRTKLRGFWYPQTYPEQPLAVRIPGTAAAKVQLWSLNSVIHERMLNTLALGAICEDRNWEGDESGSLECGSAGRQLAMRMAEDGGRHVRILACHHPIHYPDRPSFSMHMRNANDVADDFERFGKPRHVPLAHVVLSGHTHRLFPERGCLPRQTSDCGHLPLKHGQAQLITGSLCQISPLDVEWPQVCEVLRFYYSPQRPNDVTMERLIATRPTKTGRYGFLSRKGNAVSELMLIGF